MVRPITTSLLRPDGTVEPVVLFDKELFKAFLAAKKGQATAGQLKVLRSYKWAVCPPEFLDPKPWGGRNLDARDGELPVLLTFDELSATQAWDYVVNAPWHIRSLDAPTLEKPKRPRKPSKKAIKEAMEASLKGALTEEQKTILEVGLTPTNRELRTQKALNVMTAADPWERDRAWISDALTQCPLPLVRPSGSEAHRIVRETRTGSGSLVVIYTATGLPCIPYGKDAYLLDVLISEARKRGERVVTFEAAIDIMRLAGFDVGGHDYRLFREALERIGGLHISVTRRGVITGNFRVVKIQNLDIPTQEEVRRELNGQKRLIQYAFEFSDEFYEDFMRYYSVIPRNILDAFAGAPTEYAIARWIYRRVTKAQSASYIPLEEVHKEVAPSDTNARRFRTKIEKVVNTMQMHWPDLFEGFKPKRVRRKGSDVLVGFNLSGSVTPLIGDRRPTIGTTGAGQ